MISMSGGPGPPRAAFPHVAVWMALACALSTVAPAPAHAAASAARVHRAEILYEHALELIARGGFDARRLAISELEQATLLDPGNPSYELTLARTYYESGFLKNARGRFERVVTMAPDDAEGRYGLGQVWRRDWLKYLEKQSLARAVEHFSATCRLRPDHTDGWLMLVPLLIEQQDLRAAYAAARRGYESDPRRPETALEVAYTAYRLGRVEEADSIFSRAIVGLRRSVRERFEDISPVATERDTAELRRLAAPQREEFVRRFWKDQDPDVTTQANEAQLEYYARVAHAYFLFYDPKRREWDERGEVYVRYGAPARAVYNPVGMNLNYTRTSYDRYSIGRSFPANILVWEYPDLGMTVTMQDRTLSEYYLLPISMERDLDPLPNPDSLALRGDRMLARSGRGVFPILPPGVEPLPVRGVLARFEGERLPRLLAQVEAPGTPADSLWVEWTVLDSARTEKVRGRRTLSPSACDPTALRVADFAAELAPGDYLVGLSVRDGRGRRGVFRNEVALRPRDADLALSDIVVSCGTPVLSPAGVTLAVRPEPNPGARIGSSDPLTAYFEIYHLTPDRDGLARFEYVYSVRSAERDPRIWIQRLIAPRPTPDPIVASREEQHAGSLRRQFVSVPMQALPPGKYRLEIRVRDRVAATEAMRSASFEKMAAPVH